MGFVQSSVTTAANRKVGSFLHQVSGRPLGVRRRWPAVPPTVTDLGGNQFRVRWSEPFHLDGIPLQVSAVVNFGVLWSKVVVYAYCDGGRVDTAADFARRRAERAARRLLATERAG